MTLFIQNDAVGAGQSGGVDPQQASFDLGVATNGDTGLGLAAQIGDRQQVTYARTDPGAPAIRIATLVNTNFNTNPQGVDIVIVPVLANFVLNDGRSILTVGGTALPPSGSGLPGANLNNTNACLVIYDTSQNNGAGWCTARAGTNGTLDLQTSNPVILFHELSHAFRIVTNALLALTNTCNPSSPEEAAAIDDENLLRTQIAAVEGVPAVLRDRGIHCGASCAPGTTVSCCIVVTVTSGSPLSAEVAALRALRDGFLRPTEVGHAFFETLHHDYYTFSPQIATIAAGDLDLRARIRDLFVKPLIIVLGVIRQYSLETDNPTALGTRFVMGHTDVDEARERMKGYREVLADPGAIFAGGGQMADLLLHRALRSRHVVWALWEPVLLYYRTLDRHLNGGDATGTGEFLRDAIADWAGGLPVERAWGVVGADQAEDELALLERTLLKAPESRDRFRKELGRTFGHVTSVARLLN